MTLSPWVPECVVWETTLSCNLLCRHCGSTAGRPRTNELSTAEAKSLIHQLRELGTRELTLSGGELVLRSDWRELVTTARSIGMSCLVISNGMGLDDDLAMQLADCGVQSVSISLDGGKQVHDWLRPAKGNHGRSSYDEAVRAIRALGRAKLAVGVITQVSQTNRAQLPLLYETLKGFELSGWQIQLTNAMGRGATEVEILRPEDIPSLYAFVRKVQMEGFVRCLAADCIGYFRPDEGNLRAQEREFDQFWQGCQAGLRILGIQSDGGIKGCLSLPDDYLEGNIRNKSLAEIWADPRAFAYNRSFRRETLTRGCKDCAFGSICRAGCRSFAATAQDGDISYYSRCARGVSA